MSLVPVEWVLALHERRGRYITLADNNQRAIREGDTYDHGMVFSDRPLHVGEVFQLKIEELESKWAGSLVRNNNCCRDVCYFRGLPTSSERNNFKVRNYHLHGNLPHFL